MRNDQYMKAMLTIIALSLVWIAVNGIPSATVTAQSNRYQISADGSVGNQVFRLDTQTGEVLMCTMVGCEQVYDRVGKRNR